MANALEIVVKDKSKTATCRETLALCATYDVTMSGDWPSLPGGDACDGWIVLHRIIPPHGVLPRDACPLLVPPPDWNTRVMEERDVYAVFAVTEGAARISLTAAQLVHDMIVVSGPDSVFPIRATFYAKEDSGDGEGGTITSMVASGELDVKVTQPYANSGSLFPQGETPPSDLTLFRGPKGDAGETGATGETGPQGETGPMMTWSSLDEAAKTELEAAVASALKDDESFKEAVTGPQGPRGVPGIEGQNGAPGADGRDGEDGQDGASITKEMIEEDPELQELLRGPKGDKGDTGEQGPRGVQGVQGIQGVKGDTGATGATGPQGEKGDKGDKGDPGEDGADGQDGQQGPQGIQGPKGDTGAQGPKGDTGESGIQPYETKHLEPNSSSLAPDDHAGNLWKYTTGVGYASVTVTMPPAYSTGGEAYDGVRIRDFLLDIDNTDNSDVLYVEFARLGQDFELVPPDGDDLAEMTSVDGGKMARFLFTGTAFSSNGLPVISVKRITLGAVATAITRGS